MGINPILDPAQARGLRSTSSTLVLLENFCLSCLIELELRTILDNMAIARVSSALLVLYACIAVFANLALAVLNATESATFLSISNDRLSLALNKTNGLISTLSLDGQDLLGPTQWGLYVDCYCFRDPPAAWTPGGAGAEFKLFQGVDSQGIPYGGLKMSHNYNKSGRILSQYWFVRGEETGVHAFTRVTYQNDTVPSAGILQELRTLFRPNTPLWTHLSTNEEQYAPLPSRDAVSKQVTVQDATWYLGNTPNDSYVQQESDYFTKYMFHDEWRDHKVHGMYSDGSTSNDGSTFGAWLVMNTIDTYYGGPIHSDLTVDGIVYNYLVSNHHGDGVPNITAGFERTFGPQYYHFNKAPSGTSMQSLRADALKYSSPLWRADFYDSIAELVPGYVKTESRGTWRGRISLPYGAKNPIAVLSLPGVDFQDNERDQSAYQYWGNIDSYTGSVTIPRVKAGKYRLTVYADGIFGSLIRDDILVTAGKLTTTLASYREESSGKELWRVGTPDKSSGDYLHGYARNYSKPLHIRQFRQYWALHDFPTDFPSGVNFTVGKSNPAKDLNYVHWSVFGGYANSIRTEPYYQNVNNWTIGFNVKDKDLKEKKKATFTVLLAGAKTGAGNTDNSTQPFANLPFTVALNGDDLETWVIP